MGKHYVQLQEGTEREHMISIRPTEHNIYIWKKNQESFIESLLSLTDILPFCINQYLQLQQERWGQKEWQETCSKTIDRVQTPGRWTCSCRQQGVTEDVQQSVIKQMRCSEGMTDSFSIFNSRKHELKNLKLEFIKTVRQHMVCT